MAAGDAELNALVPSNSFPLEHNPSSWNQLDGLCPVKQASPVRANPIGWNRSRFQPIGFRSSIAR
jgi:hypothetical protein